MKSWKITTLETLSSNAQWSFSAGPFGSKIKAKDYIEYGVPVVRGVNLAKGIFFDEDYVFISSEKSKEVEYAHTQSGDLVFTCKGTIGQVSMIPNHARFPFYVVSSNQVKARLNPEVAIAEFYYYWFTSPQGQQTLMANVVTTGVPRISNSVATIRSLEVPYPTLTEQRAVATLLGALDDKIVCNERIADTSRQLGVALYRESITSEPRSIAIEALSGYLNRGQAPKYTEDEDGMTVLNQRCVRAGRVLLDPARRTLASRVQEARRLKHGDVLVNSTGVGTLGRVAIWSHAIEATVDSHVTIVRINPEVVPTVVGGFAMLATQPRIEALGEGSTGQTELSKAKLGQLEIEVPSGETSVLAERLTALEEKADAALAESRTLAELRDTLLPQLMSGKLRVRDAEKIVEDHV